MENDLTSVIFRPATLSDVVAIASLVKDAGPGMTTLPKDQAQVAAYVDRSVATLNGDRNANRLLFVIEQSGVIIGISGIIPRLGLERPFYSFKRARHSRRSTVPALSLRYETLQLTTDFDGCTELATLFLAPSARGGGFGRLLSLARLAFILHHPHLFEDRLMADIRGWVSADGVSPFWNHFASRFIDLDFDSADQLSAVDGRFIAELLPSLPVLLNLLPESVAKAVGRPHDQSIGAYGMLCSVGFEPTDLCDVFDGGPAIVCTPSTTRLGETLRPAATCDDKRVAQSLLQYRGQSEDFRAVLARGDLATAATCNEALTALGVSDPREVFLADIGSGARQRASSSMLAEVSA